MKVPIVTFTILQYRPGSWYSAFANMGRWLMKPFVSEGLQFQKMMGSGRGFGVIPDFSTYVFLAVWDSEKAAQLFFRSERWRQFVSKAHQMGVLWMEPLKSQGQWDGVNPFSGTAVNPSGQPLPVAVLTRATIRTGALLDFWRHVPQARSRLSAHRDSLLFSIGVGEKPLVQQCTISVWRDAAAIDQFAYRQSGHKEIVKATRQRRWYTEELFARFTVRQSEGEFFKEVSKQIEEAENGSTVSAQRLL